MDAPRGYLGSAGSGAQVYAARPHIGIIDTLTMRPQAGPAPSDHEGTQCSGIQWPQSSCCRARVSGAGEQHEGRFRGFDAEHLLLAISEPETTAIALASIDTIWVLHTDARRQARHDAIVGAIASAGVMMVSAALLCAKPHCIGDIIGAGGAGATMGTAGGALVGAMNGNASQSWVRWYP